MQKFINMDNYEVVSDVPGYIMCDEEIAEIIAILNQKGYVTTYSCAGHNKNGFNPSVFEIPATEKQFILDNSYALAIVYEDEEIIKYVSRFLGDSTYVGFSEKYDFSYIPEGFVCEDDNFGICIRCLNPYFNEDDHSRKSDEEIEEHLKNAREKLYEWAQSLEYRKKRL